MCRKKERRCKNQFFCFERMSDEQKIYYQYYIREEMGEADYEDKKSLFCLF